MIKTILFSLYIASTFSCISTASTASDELVNQPLYQFEFVEDVEQESFISGLEQLRPDDLLSMNAAVANNMVNRNMQTNTTSFEAFDMDSYYQRTSTAQSKSLITKSSLETVKNSDILSSESFVPDDLQSYEDKNDIKISPFSIIGEDTRTQVSNPKISPYIPTARLVMTYKNVFNSVTQTFHTRRYVGTGFLEGHNILATAGHNVYGDVTNDGEFENNEDDPRFADEVEVYLGMNGSSEQNANYTYYAKALVVNIDLEYFTSPNFDHDWAAVELDRNIGYSTGWYGKMSNWYEKDYDVYSYGYPGDKPATMWETHGKLKSSTSRRYSYDFDTVGGQSGSPVFMNTSSGAVYVIGIHTSGGGSINGGTRINSFIFHYLNSFVTSHNVVYQVGTIRPNNYGFADAYPTDDYTKNNFATHNVNSNFSFRTRRYRTGYIQGEYIVMSPIKTGITEAYIEYQFDKPVYRIEVDLAHWREYASEWLDKNSGIAELQTWHEKDWWNPFDSSRWVKKFDLLSDETALSRNREQPKTYTIEFNTPVYGFRFYSKMNNAQASSSNRGRICIGNMNVYSKAD